MSTQKNHQEETQDIQAMEEELLESSESYISEEAVDRQAMEEAMLKSCEDAISQVLQEHGIDPGSAEAASITQEFLDDIQVAETGKSKAKNIAYGLGMMALGGLSVYGVGRLVKRFSANDDLREIEYDMTGLIGD